MQAVIFQVYLSTDEMPSFKLRAKFSCDNFSVLYSKCLDCLLAQRYRVLYNILMLCHTECAKRQQKGSCGIMYPNNTIGGNW